MTLEERITHKNAEIKLLTDLEVLYTTLINLLTQAYENPQNDALAILDLLQTGYNAKRQLLDHRADSYFELYKLLNEQLGGGKLDADQSAVS